jgi:hypothetical protein
MCCYVVFFDPDDADIFRKRVDVFCKTSRLPQDLVHEQIDTTNGQTVGIYITAETAKNFPKFVSQFNAIEIECA